MNDLCQLVKHVALHSIDVASDEETLPDKELIRGCHSDTNDVTGCVSVHLVTRKRVEMRINIYIYRDIDILNIDVGV